MKKLDREGLSNCLYSKYIIYIYIDNTGIFRIHMNPVLTFIAENSNMLFPFWGLIGFSVWLLLSVSPEAVVSWDL